MLFEKRCATDQKIAKLLWLNCTYSIEARIFRHSVTQNTMIVKLVFLTSLLMVCADENQNRMRPTVTTQALTAPHGNRGEQSMQY